MKVLQTIAESTDGAEVDNFAVNQHRSAGTPRRVPPAGNRMPLPALSGPCGSGMPALTAKEASAEVVAAIAYASSYHAAWLWDGAGP